MDLILKNNCEILIIKKKLYPYRQLSTFEAKEKCYFCFSPKRSTISSSSVVGRNM